MALLLLLLLFSFDENLLSKVFLIKLYDHHHFPPFFSPFPITSSSSSST